MKSNYRIYLNTSNGEVGVFKNSTGKFTPKVTGISALGDIALSPINGQLFGDTTTEATTLPKGEENPNQLVIIDTKSASQTLIGPLGVTNLLGLEFAPDGNLYGTSKDGGFYTVNTNTGTATEIAQIPNFSAAGDLVYAPNLKAFLATSTTPGNSTLFAISPDGTSKEIGSIGYENVFGIQNVNGKIVGFTKDGQELSINPKTGAGKLIRDITGLNDGDILGASTQPKLDFKTVSLLNTDGGTIGVINAIGGSFTPLFPDSPDGPDWGDIAISPKGKIYADTTTQGGSDDALYRIDTLTGQATKIGDLGVTNILGLEFGPNGKLYGTSEDGGFYRINTNTGKATLISSNPDFSAAGDLVYDPLTGNFLATSTTPDNSTLFAISPITGAEKIIGQIGFADVRGIQFQNGDLLGYTKDGKQIDIDPTTGTGTFIQNITGLDGDVLGVSSISQLLPNYGCAYDA